MQPASASCPAPPPPPARAISKSRIKRNIMDVLVHLRQGDPTKLGVVDTAADAHFTRCTQVGLLVFQDETVLGLRILTQLMLIDAGLQDEFNYFSAVLDQDISARSMAAFGRKLLCREGELKRQRASMEHEQKQQAPPPPVPDWMLKPVFVTNSVLESQHVPVPVPSPSPMGPTFEMFCHEIQEWDWSPPRPSSPSSLPCPSSPSLELSCHDILDSIPSPSPIHSPAPYVWQPSPYSSPYKSPI